MRIFAGFPFRLPNVPCVWKLVAILAEQAHVVHSIFMKVLLRFTLAKTILFRHAHNGLPERQLVVPGLPRDLDSKSRYVHHNGSGNTSPSLLSKQMKSTAPRTAYLAGFRSAPGDSLLRMRAG